MPQFLKGNHCALYIYLYIISVYIYVLSNTALIYTRVADWARLIGRFDKCLRHVLTLPPRILSLFIAFAHVWGLGKTEGKLEIWFITVTHIFMQPVLIFFSHISIIHARLTRSRRWHLVGLTSDPSPKSPLAKYEKTLVSRYQFRRKNQMSLKCQLPFSPSIYLSPSHTHTHTRVS